MAVAANAKTITPMSAMTRQVFLILFSLVVLICFFVT